MVDAIVSYAIEKLGDFIIQEVGIRAEVTEAATWLKNEMGFLIISVRAAEERIQSLSAADKDIVGNWIEKVRDVGHRTNHILETYTGHKEKYASLKKGVMGRMKSCMCIPNKEFETYDIAKEMDSLKGEVITTKNWLVEYGIAHILRTPVVRQRKRASPRPVSFQNNVDVVGLEDVVKTLLSQLLNKGSSLGMISIHGMGGLGKSTLAGKLYHSSKLSHFKTRAWVCVSEDYDITHVLKKIIKSFKGVELDPSKEMDESDLLCLLKQFLDVKDKYLVVIDDMWDIEVWRKIKHAFPDKNNGSRIIITTRNIEVAQEVDDICFVHKLRFLSEDESWQLFCKRSNPTPNLEDLGKEMVGKCGGLPLAIVVLSGLLVHKSYEFWSTTKDNLWIRLKGKSLEIQEILSLSYDDLPSQIKQCFLYLARFPEDHTFNVDKLLQLWNAEKFTSEAISDGRATEDVAEDYLNKLINRNMIEIATLYWHGEVKECRVHDLVRDLAMQRATKDKFLGIFDSNKKHPSPTQWLQGQTRQAIYNGIGEYLKLLGPSSDDKYLNSLALPNISGRFIELENMKQMCIRFENLKVLDLNTVKSDMIPQQIGNLVSLTFLGLTRCPKYDTCLEIPQSIGKLVKLQTLCGAVNSKYQFPAEICKLKELTHLDRFSRGTGTLSISSDQTKLQTLRSIEYRDWIQIDTVNLTQVHSLSIPIDRSEEEKNVEYKLDSVAQLTSLQSFFIGFYTFPSDKTTRVIPTLEPTRVIPTLEPLSLCRHLEKVYISCKIKDPSDFKFLPYSVTKLRLRGSGFIQDPMPILGSLSNLASIVLDKAYMGKKIKCSHDAFPSLQLLNLRNMPHLEEWQVEKGAMCSLKTFSVLNCKRLRVPEQIKGIPRIPDMYCI